MTNDFCYEIQIIKPRYHRRYSPVDFKLDNFMLRGGMRIFKFSGRLSRNN